MTQTRQPRLRALVLALGFAVASLSPVIAAEPAAVAQAEAADAAEAAGFEREEAELVSAAETARSIRGKPSTGSHIAVDALCSQGEA